MSRSEDIEDLDPQTELQLMKHVRDALDENNQALRQEIRHLRKENDALAHMYQMAMQDLRGCREELVDVKRMLYGQQY